MTQTNSKSKLTMKKVATIIIAIIMAFSLIFGSFILLLGANPQNEETQTHTKTEIEVSTPETQTDNQPVEVNPNEPTAEEILMNNMDNLNEKDSFTNEGEEIVAKENVEEGTGLIKSVFEEVDEADNKQALNGTGFVMPNP